MSDRRAECEDAASVSQLHRSGIQDGEWVLGLKREMKGAARED